MQVVIDGDKALSCYLMWSDIKDNHNKFYIAQGLKRGDNYYLWTRYGRVGLNGVGSAESLINLEYLKKLYQKKYK
jgi:poly [ADP-ribose] polymerase